MSSSSPRLPLSLDRMFLPVEPGTDPEYLRLAGRQVGWQDLLAAKCVVVLGEAGIGKTAELRAQVERLQREGEAAFFLPVEFLARHGVQASLNVDGQHLLRRWKESQTTPAWFMLDSVDESTLKGHALAEALNAFGRELEPFLERVHLVLSSRASDWRPTDESDLHGLAKHLSTSAPQEGAGFKIVQMAPLDERQILAFASYLGVSEVDKFLADVRAANAWAFLERPLDVQWLARYWRESGRLGTLRDLMDFNANERLREKQGRPASLSLEKVRAGARALALVASLCRVDTFRVPGEAINSRSDGAVDPSAVLTGWTSDEVTELLARGLFDEATYGRVRMHHRSMREFLSAERLAEMLRDGLPRSDLNALLFRASSGRQVIARHLAAIVPWLAGSDPQVRRWVIRNAPESLIDEGDPASLSVDERKEVLRAYAERFAGRRRVFHHFDSFGLRRFASPDLAQAIRALLCADPPPADHLRETLLELVEVGKVASLAQDTLSVALSSDASPYVRAQAVRAVAATGDAAQLAALAGVVNVPAARDARVTSELLEALCPLRLSTADALRAAVSVAATHRRGHDSVGMALRAVVGRCTQQQRSAFLGEVVTEIVFPGPPDQCNDLRVRADRLWLGDCLAELVAHVIGGGPPFPETLAHALEVTRILGHTAHGLTADEEVNRALQGSPEARRMFFWHVVARTAAGRKFPRNYWQLQPSPEVELNAADVPWLSEDCRSRSDVRERLFAFSCLVDLVGTTQQGPAVLADIAASSDAAHGDEALAKRLDRIRQARTAMPYPHIRFLEIRRGARERRRSSVDSENALHLRSVLDGIRSGEHERELFFLYEAGQPTSSDKDGSVSRDRIAERYGPEVADAAIVGMVAYWRRHEPLAREEGELNRTPYRCITGLAGLNLETQRGVDVDALPDPLFRKAVAYGCWELNGFPAWFAACAERRPEVVREILAPSIRLDYGYDGVGEEAPPSRVIYKLTNADTRIKGACAPVFLDLLRAGDPSHVQTLRNALACVGPLQGTAAQELLGIARQRALGYAQDLRSAALWWRQWYCMDAMGAVVALEVWLAGAADPFQMAAPFFARLRELNGRKTNDAPPRFGLEILLCLIPLAYRYVRPTDDIRHEGVYSPGDRDDAQDFRDSLVSSLTQIEGPETVGALERFAADPALSDMRDWLLHLADVRATDNASGRGMVLSEAVAFSRSLVLQPETAEELFRVALDRLADVVAYIKDGDFSTRAAFSPSDAAILEEPVQNFVAHELEESSRGQYSVVREPEVTRKKKPDIRLVNPRCRGPVTVELKIAERWTIPQLEDALQSQLVGTYMKDNNSRHGILGVCSSGPKHKWELAPGKQVTFPEVVDHLSRLAEEITKKDPRIGGLRVVAIDFH